MTLAKNLPAKLTLKPQLPELRGNSKSNFEFSSASRTTAARRSWSRFRATAPQNFDATFTEQYGSQELNALPLDAGQSKDVKLKVTPPNTVAAGKYKVAAQGRPPRTPSATSDLALDITGQPKIDIAGREGLLSARAAAGEETSIPVVVTNTGTAPAEQIELSGSAPERLEGRVRAEDHRPHRAEREQGSAGADHADRQGDRRRLRRDRPCRGARRDRRRRPSASRWRPRRMWGIVGVGIIGIALLVMVGAVARFGRR